MQSKTFKKTKGLVTAEPVMLQYYDPTKGLTVHCDANDKSITVALPQDDQPLSSAAGHRILWKQDMLLSKKNYLL